MRLDDSNAAARDLRAIFDVGPLGDLSDGQLLDRFVDRREGAVFEALIRRQGPMVLGVCRRILRDHHDAEDAFQATFLVLARKAGSVRPREKVGNWLHGVARQTALKARSARARRRSREVQAPELPEAGSTPESAPDDLLAGLDRELGRLPEKYRIPIVLCELQGKTHKQAGEELGWPIGTVSGRLSRGKALLGRKLARLGASAPAVDLASRLAEARDAASTDLVASTARAAFEFAEGHATPAGVVSAEVAGLAREVIHTMFRIKIKLVASALFLGACLAVGGTSLAYRATVADPDGPVEAPQRDLIATQGPQAKAQVPEADPMTSYAFKFEPEEVYEFPELKVDYREFHMATGPVTVIPISTERGITGAMILGGGTFRDEPEDGKVFQGHSRAAMIRFNPEEQPKILPLDKGKKVKDLGTFEMGRHLLSVVIRHCYQSNKQNGRIQEVLIPPRGAFAAAVYSKEHGDLLISFNDTTATIFNFTDRKHLFEKK